ncbi:MAG: DUF1566 domain-containing protein, partial [Candidatus Pacebacteria bacterium]|nr:DUF1566 domain-containing protein [Candidatus Paceibacterota bacterium]
VAWGSSTNPFVEGTAFIQSPNDQQNLIRKVFPLEAGSQTGQATSSVQYQDTNNNSVDFELAATSTQQALPEPSSGLPAITNLMAIPSPKRLAVDLLWTCPTSASAYIITMDGQAISQNLNPKPMGEVEFFHVDNLQDNIEYSFAIKYTGQTGETSLVSDSVSVKAWPGFVDNSDGTVLDLRTNLTWHKDANAIENMAGASTTQYEADLFLKDNFSDWRLANFKELASLFNYDFSAPSVWKGFENAVPGQYWSKSLWEENFNAWAVDFSNGNVNYEHFWGQGQSQFPFLTAQGQELPGGMINDDFDFTDNGDGTVTDNTTGLIWLNAGFAVVDDSARLSWLNAFHYANNITLCNDGTLQGNSWAQGDCNNNGGVKYDDWRLPNVQEMMEITKLGWSEILPWMSGYSFYYWTGTKANSDNFWWVGNGYNTGVIYPNSKDSRANIQLVRDP